MIINFSLSNAFSFKDKQNLSMVASSLRKDDINFANVINVDNVDSPRLLKSALVYGANASGKSNFIKTVSIMREIVLNSMQAIEFGLTRFMMPFLLDDHGTQNASEMEVEFVIDNFKYRYGLAVKHGKIQEEWLYYTPNSRETMLFVRNEAEIEYNKTAFVEATAFVDGKLIQKTREDVPFISVVAGFNGEHASRVVKWFRNIVAISGANETAFTQITLKLLNESEDFVVWLKKILPAFQICDIFLDEINPDFSLNHIQTDDNNIKSLFESIQNIAKTQKQQAIKVKKKTQSGEIAVPIEFESEGTKKIVYLLGPIYNTLKNSSLLLVDEFDSKFHTLLSKFIFRIFHEQSENNGQIIAIAQDVNLMSTDCFRRDQIWFVDKTLESGGSNLYSLVEYKEKQRTLKSSYGSDYLNGSFDAIPLFDKFD